MIAQFRYFFLIYTRLKELEGIKKNKNLKLEIETGFLLYTFGSYKL